MSSSSGTRRRVRDPRLIAVPVAIFAAFFAAFAFSPFGGASAKADHWHDYCNAGGSTWHGLVHGGSTTDNAWQARIELGCGATLKHCEGGSVGAGSKGYSQSIESTCQKLVYGTSWISYDQECWGWSYVSQTGRINPHYHYAHNRCQIT